MALNSASSAMHMLRRLMTMTIVCATRPNRHAMKCDRLPKVAQHEFV
jgi:hypothetical protein